ncbi:hypothetical protein [Streptomyces sp. NBC_00470]|uniref:hypothetical protein n=1 Tax=Streptomyces sp. NBC_00470 TaxID=2975753 RepID=UPI0030E2DB41
MSGTLLTPSAIRAEMLKQLISDYLPAAPLAADAKLALLWGRPAGADNPTVTDVKAVELAVGGYQRQIPVWTEPAVDQAAMGVTLAEAAQFGPLTDSNGSGVPMTHVALLNDTNVLAVWQVDYAVSADRNESVAIPAGSLELDLT